MDKFTADNLLLEDNNVSTACARFVELMRRFGNLFSGENNPVPGLPILRMSQVTDTERGTNAAGYMVYRYVTPWGKMQELGPTDTSYDCNFYQYFPLYSVVLAQGDPIPSSVAPMPGAVALDTITGMATVYTLDGRETLASLRVNMDQRSVYDLAKSLRVALAREGVPVLPAKIYRCDSVAYPFEEKHWLVNARAMNREVSVPVVGFAYDNNSDRELVYLHIVGPKAACRSIWATLNQSGRRVLTVAVSGDTAHTVVSTKNYVTYSAAVDVGLGIYRLVIVDRRVTGRDVDDYAYLLVRAGDDENALFAARLDAILPIPIRAEWGQTLKVVGARNRLFRHGTVGGDVAKLFMISGSNRWIELVSDLVKSGELAL